MSVEPEQMGDLGYAPNPDYPYPFPVERPTHFWMTEQTGRLGDAIERYFQGERLSPDELMVIKAYLQQYLERALLTGDARRDRLLQQLATLRTRRDIERFADDIAEFGVEPF